MNIAVVGTGYVGLVSGTCFAETGNHVICVDNNAEKVEKLRNGIVPIYEPGLNVLFERNTHAGRLSFTTNLAEAIEHAEVVFLALPTPPGEDGSADLSYVLGVAAEIGPLLQGYKVLVDKSTVPIGTAERVRAAVAAGTDQEFDVVSNPEFLREGVAVDDFLKPDRVVIGTSSERAREVMHRLYEPFVRQGNPIYYMDERSAEMTKYAANSYLATRITFMNEIANLCEKVGANVDEVRKGMGSDNRIGKRFLFPGVGYGGSCFPKDVQALERTASENEYPFNLLRSVMAVNNDQKLALVRKVKAHFGEALNGKTFALWGLAFKPNTDDIREAPALYTIEALLEAGATIKAFDPEARENIAARYADKVELFESKYEALKDADALLILTEWAEFRTPDFHEIKQRLRQPIILDGRNVYSLEQMAKAGFHYESIGRSVISLPQTAATS